MRAYHEEYRYRVVSVMLATEHSVEAWEIREYKTVEPAERCFADWEKQGKSVLFQTAKVTWLTPDELAAEVETLPKVME